MSLEVTVWFHPSTLATHLSEKCAKQQGRPAKESTDNLLPSIWDALWCERCAPESKRLAILEGRRA